MIVVWSEAAGRATGSTVLASRYEAHEIHGRPSASTSRKRRNGLRPKSSSLINRRQPGYDYRNHQTRGLGVDSLSGGPTNPVIPTSPSSLALPAARPCGPDPSTATRIISLLPRVRSR